MPSPAFEAPRDDAALGVAGLDWNPNGYALLSGSLLAWHRRLDLTFARLALAWSASELAAPPLIDVTVLSRVDWLGNFPQMATFAAVLADDPDSLDRFRATRIPDASGALRLAEPGPVTQVLAPAACWHVYGALSGRRLEGAAVHTLCACCHRRERHYAPLRRQWSFSMREIVMMGDAADVSRFAAEAAELALKVGRGLGLAVDLRPATDPFFGGESHPARLLQRVDPVKLELTTPDGLAIASINRHRTRFGRAFDIQIDGCPASSACLAFGIERWLAAIMAVHGPDPSHWPSPESLS